MNLSSIWKKEPRVTPKILELDPLFQLQEDERPEGTARWNGEGEYQILLVLPDLRRRPSSYQQNSSHSSVMLSTGLGRRH